MEKNRYKKHHKIPKNKVNDNPNIIKPPGSENYIKKEELKMDIEKPQISETIIKNEIIKKEEPKADIENTQISKKVSEKEEKIEEPKKENNIPQKEKSKKVIKKLGPKKIIKKRTPSVNIIQSNFNKRKNKLNKIINLDSNNNNVPNKNDNTISTPGLIGLMNIGATCYMNATLQCFSNITKLRECLIEKKMYLKLKKYKEIKKLSFALAEVIKNLWENSEKKFYSPENFKNIISEMNPLFKGVAANDPKDLILFLLENMHRELNIHKKNKDNNNCVKDYSNFYEVYNNFKESYINKNKSIISDEFYGYQNIITTCNNCQVTINNIQIYNILFFPLEEIRKYKNYNDNNVKIIDCFEYYTKIDFSPDFYCNYCNQNYSSNSQTKFVNVPHTLIINLNRGKGLEYNVNIVFDEYLNLNKYIIDENTPYYYELIGIICHFGSNDMGGHFVAFCKNCNNCEWYKFNDQIVTKCPFSEVKQSGLPYVLFYNYVQT